MAKKSMILKQQRAPKFSSRQYNRCKLCGRPHAYLRDYGICRICFRELAYKGQIPGVKRPLGNLPGIAPRGRPGALYVCQRPPEEESLPRQMMEVFQK